MNVNDLQMACKSDVYLYFCDKLILSVVEGAERVKSIDKRNGGA